jgi:hypothetical protein
MGWECAHHAPSVTRRAAVTSELKSTWPGESIRLIKNDLSLISTGASSAAAASASASPAPAAAAASASGAAAPAAPLAAAASSAALPSAAHTQPSKHHDDGTNSST